MAVRLPGREQSNQTGEIVAVLIAAQQVPNFAPLHIISDSKYAIDGLTTHLKHWEKCRWIGIVNSTLFRATACCLRRCTAITTFKWTKGHNDEVGNVGADTLAGIGAAKTTPDHLNTKINDLFNLTGAQISALSQSLAYQGIRMTKKTTSRTDTNTTLDLTRMTLHTETGRLHTNATIWTSLRTPHTSRNVADFLWKAMHGAHKCGPYWARIPNFSDRSICKFCNVTETMAHILTECTASGQSAIWSLTRSLWLKKHSRWPNPSLGSILGCNLLTFSDHAGKPLRGAGRLYGILVSKAAFLIWKLRCEWLIGNDGDVSKLHTDSEIYNRWKHCVNSRLTSDRISTHKKFGKSAISKHLVLQTWSGTLQNERDLPIDWIQDEVLVGMDWPP
ncbi:hypothetical protein BKA93DRAFT_741506 [Sparassis latifolia]